jgi:hypothetical protein
VLIIVGGDSNVISGGRRVVWAAVLGSKDLILSTGAAVPFGDKFCYLAGEFLDTCRSVLLSVAVVMLPSTDWGAAPGIRSAQGAAVSRAPFGWPAKMDCLVTVSELYYMLWRKSPDTFRARF